MFKIIRQGDVLIKQVDSIPKEAVGKKKGSEVTIALGEATGHHHTLYGKLPISLLQFNDKRFLQIQEEVELRHQEHHCLKIDPGKYEIIIEQEHDYYDKEIKKVVD